MKTNQIIESIDRELCGMIVRQRTKDSFMNLDDVVNIVYKWRIENGVGAKGFNFSNWLTNENTKEFLAELENEINAKPYIKGAKGRSGWAHPFLVIKILTHYNPKFEVQVYKWLFDFLIQSRIRGGDSYKLMCGVLFNYTTDKTNFYKKIQNLANFIKDKLGVSDWNIASEAQLQNRDILQNYITDATRTLKSSKLGIKLGIEMYNARKDRNLTQEVENATN